MAKPETIEGRLSYSFAGDFWKTKPVVVDLKTASFPIPDEVEVNSDTVYLLGVRIGTTSIDMDVFPSNGKFIVENKGDKAWLEYHETEMSTENEKAV